jgi:L-fucose isomerase-like protein
MKRFELDDTFLLSKIIDDMDIQLDLNEFMDSMQNEKSAEKAGGAFFLLLFKKLHKGRQAIPEFIASMLEIEVEEARRLKLTEIKEFFIELWKQEDISDFFKLAQDQSK